MRCDHCGMANPATVIFCRKCGERLVSTSREASPPSFRLPIPLVTGPISMRVPQKDDQPPDGYRKRRKRGWILTGLVLVLLAVGAGLAFALLNAPPSADLASQTLLAYCSALKRGDYRQAYEQLSSAFHQQEKEEDFAYPYQQKGGVSSCVVSNVSLASSSATGTVKLNFGERSTAMYTLVLVFEKDAWKIQGQSPG
jgi:hypothetical protein